MFVYSGVIYLSQSLDYAKENITPNLVKVNLLNITKISIPPSYTYSYIMVLKCITLIHRGKLR